MKSMETKNENEPQANALVQKIEKTEEMGKEILVMMMSSQTTQIGFFEKLSRGRKASA